MIRIWWGILAVLLGLAILAGWLEASGYDALSALTALWDGAFGSWYAFTSATLVRSEGLLLVPLLALPLAWRGGPGRLARVAATVAAFAVLLAPWVARNWAVFDRPVLSNNLGYLLASTNCADA